MASWWSRPLWTFLYGLAQSADSTGSQKAFALSLANLAAVLPCPSCSAHCAAHMHGNNDSVLRALRAGENSCVQTVHTLHRAVHQRVTGTPRPKQDCAAFAAHALNHLSTLGMQALFLTSTVQLDDVAAWRAFWASTVPHLRATTGRSVMVCVRSPPESVHDTVREQWTALAQTASGGREGVLCPADFPKWFSTGTLLAKRPVVSIGADGSAADIQAAVLPAITVHCGVAVVDSAWAYKRGAQAALCTALWVGVVVLLIVTLIRLLRHKRRHAAHGDALGVPIGGG